MQTFTPSQYLKIDIASQFGHDKMTWDDRIQWFDANKDKLQDLMPMADNPALFYAGMLAWQAYEKGEPSGYPISLDATSSGLQILSVLTGDKLAAQICNVVDSGGREDAYTAVYEEMVRSINEVGKISRDMTKQAIMTSLYGSEAEPKKVFGTGALLNVFYQTMERMAPGVWELNQAMLHMWSPQAYSNDWILPDNFHVHVKVISTIKENVSFLNEPFEVTRKINAPKESGRSLGANMVHSIDGMMVREMTRRCNHDRARVNTLRWLIMAGVTKDHIENNHTKMVRLLWNHYTKTGFLSARILDHLQPYNISLVDTEPVLELIDSLPEKPFQIISIHDCFRCLPNYANDMRKQYTLQLELIAKSNLLSSIVSQIIGRDVEIGKLDPNLHKEVAQSNYALS